MSTRASIRSRSGSPAKPARASTLPASIAISIRCCRASCGPKRRAVRTPTPPRSSTSNFSKSTARRDRRHRSTRSSIISPARCRALSTSPSSYSAQSAAVSAAQGVAQNLNSMTASIQQLRSQAEAGIANDVQTANTALQQIAQINQQLIAASPDSSTATLEDQRDQDVTQLSQLMNVNVVQGSNNQISVFTGTGQQLVAQGRRLRNCHSTTSGHCRRRRNGAPIRARTAPARSR